MALHGIVSVVVDLGEGPPPICFVNLQYIGIIIFKEFDIQSQALKRRPSP